MTEAKADPAPRGRLVRRDNPAIEIAGTFERLVGLALVGDAGLTATGALDFDYDGGTTIWWDEQRTALRRGLRVFVDADGAEILEDAVVVLLDDGRILEPRPGNPPDAS